MTLFQIAIPENRKASARFVGKVRRKLLHVLASEPEVTQSKIAEVLGVDRSVISRQLKGKTNMSLGRVAEIAWAAGYRPDLKFEKVCLERGDNRPIPLVPALETGMKVGVSSASAPVDIGIPLTGQSIEPQVLVEAR